MAASNQLLLAKTAAISISLLATGGILTTSAYTIPLLRDRSTDARSSTASLHQLRAIFSSGSHIFPQLAILSCGLFGYLSYLSSADNEGAKARLYAAAAAGVASIVPFTLWVMVPACNGRLIELEERAKGEGKEAVRREGGDEEVTQLLERFKRLNYVRGVLIGVGGVLGLWASTE